MKLRKFHHYKKQTSYDRIPNQSCDFDTFQWVFYINSNFTSKIYYGFNLREIVFLFYGSSYDFLKKMCKIMCIAYSVLCTIAISTHHTDFVSKWIYLYRRNNEILNSFYKGLIYLQLWAYYINNEIHFHTVINLREKMTSRR